MYHWRGNILLMHHCSSAVGILSLLSALLFPLTQHHSLSRAQAHLLTVPEQQICMMPVQMLANSVSRSCEAVLAAVKDTEGTLLQLQLPLVNGWVKRNIWKGNESSRRIARERCGVREGEVVVCYVLDRMQFKLLGGSMLLAHRSCPLKHGCVGAAGVSEQLCFLCDYLLFQPTTDSG